MPVQLNLFPFLFILEGNTGCPAGQLLRAGRSGVFDDPFADVAKEVPVAGVFTHHIGFAGALDRVAKPS